MRRAILPRLFSAGFVLASVALSQTLCTRAELGAQNCTCATAQPFGSCTESKTNYPDVFPGSVLVVPRQGDPSLIYVVDLYGGFTYFSTINAGKFDFSAKKRAPSPRGSNATTGLAFRQDGAATTLFWAIEDRIISSSLIDRIDQGAANVRDLGAVQLEKLAGLLRDITGDTSIVTGRLGGITYHKSRGKLWGVDIENDVYFEFEENGQLSLNEGKPVFFFNPRRNARSGGAYGNSIAYVESGGKEYFDIPVGLLADRRPTEVRRVYAVDTAAPDAHRIGDSTGVFYSLGATVGSPKWVTGIGFWANSCAANQHSELLLDLDEISGEPKILQVPADEPDSATIADFACITEAPTEVKLTWRKTKTYTNLKITRKSLTKPAAPVATVFENAAFDSDPQNFTDKGVLDGTYEYTATVTAKSAVPTVTCRVTLGVGSVIASRPFLGAGSSIDPTPYALAVVNNETILVADLNTGDAEMFDLDLAPKGTLDGPIAKGQTAGLAWDSALNRLYWLENDSGKHFIHTTETTGAKVGTAVAVDSPLNLSKGTQLAEIAFDSVKGYLWTVDLKNKVIYAVTPQGAIAPEFKSTQIASPEATGLLGGGVAVFSGDDKLVTLDLPLGKDASGIVDQIGRFEYTRSNFSTKKEIARLDLRSTTGATDFGGIEVVKKSETDQFEYVVGVDTRTIYKIALNSPTAKLVPFRRGDVNNDAAINISDPSFLLGHLFKGGAEPACMQTADADDSGTVDISDAVLLFNYLFKGGATPAAPFTVCGIDLGSALSCGAANCVDA